MEIELLSAENFRRRIAGLEDPSRKLETFDLKSIEADAVSFIAVMPELFGEDLDRKTLWERIANGLHTASAKSGGDVGLFVQELLVYIKADPGQVASNERFAMHLEMLLLRPKEIQDQFVRTMSAKSYLIVTKARAVWNLNKAKVAS